MIDNLINLAGAFGIVLAIIWLTTASLRLSRMIQASASAVDDLDALTDKLIADLEKVDENRAKIRREIDRLEESREQNQGLLERLEANLSPEALAGRQRYYVLSDRRTPSDHEWLVPITNPSAQSRHWHPWYIQSWARGRTYLCWAPSPDIARRTADARFSTTAGFALGHPQQPPEPVVPREHN